MPDENVHLATGLIAELRKLSNSAEFFQELGKTFTHHRLFDHAKAALDVSLELDPCDAFTHLYLGNWFYRRRQYEPALERFEYAMELMPNEPICLSCIADVFERQHRFGEAEAFHKKALELDPADEDAKHRYARFRRRREA